MDSGAGHMKQEMLTLYSASKLSLVGEGQRGRLYEIKKCGLYSQFLNLVLLVMDSGAGHMKQETLLYIQFINLALLVKDSVAGCMEQEMLTLFSF